MCTKSFVGSTADTGSGQGGSRYPARRLWEAGGGWGRLGEVEEGCGRLEEAPGGWGRLRDSALWWNFVSHISSMEATVPGAALKQGL